MKGEIAQQLVADFFQDKFGQPAINKARSGHDVICGEHKIEVKSISSITRSCKSKKRLKMKKQMNVFLQKREFVKEDTTLFSYVIKDDPLIPDPKILTVQSELVFELMKESKSVEEVVIPLWWVKENYDYRYSKLK
jgi:hypothetical protein